MKIPNRIDFGIAIAGILAISIVIYSGSLMSRTVRQLMPLIQITNDIKVKVSSAHLWFEEGIEGDDSVNMQIQVFDNIDAAIEMVQDQQSQIQEIEPRLYLQMQIGFKTLTRELQNWKELTNARLANPSISAPGTPSDNAYDDSFRKILRLCDLNQQISTRS
jgi:hypothetical protein